jgi:hypothetical protein
MGIKRKCCVALAAAVMVTAPMLGQTTEVYASNIRTVVLRVNDIAGGALPVMRQGRGDRLNVSFDEMSHDYHRYVYRVEHVDADFRPEEGLFVSDYVRATADEGLIEDFRESRNTTVLYTHYSFSLPNDYLKPLLSGNYRLTVYDAEADDETPLWRAYFAVAEDAVSITATASTDTEIDRSDTHQQLAVEVSWRGMNVQDARREMRLVVRQNDRPTTAVCPPATGQTLNALRWEHTRGLLFDAGNEYRKMELPSTRYPGLHTLSVGYNEPYYHATLFTDEVRRHYLYDEDQNGRSVTVADDVDDVDTEADYLWVHFALQTDSPFDGAHVYVNGRWTHDAFLPEYELTYHAENGCYEGSLFLKQGYYSYQYVVVDADGRATPAPAEGDFYQTENEYTLLVYYRPRGSRYDRLVGTRTFSYRP